MINFYVCYSDTQLSININKTSTFDEFISVINNKYQLSGNDIKVILLGYGLINDLGELPIESLELGNGQYIVIVHNLNDPGNIWKNYCTKNIIGNQILHQEGYYINDKFPVCFACKKFCCQSIKSIKDINDREFICMCEKCNLSEIIYNEKAIIFANINSILINQSKLMLQKEEAKIKKLRDEILARDFNFASSNKFGLQRVKMYEDKSIQEKIRSIIPIHKLEFQAKENSKLNNETFRDEFVKSLLLWFKTEFFSWCNQPKCSNCGKDSDKYIETQKPSDDEIKWLASRTEVYSCTSCNTINRFPRYNNPSKLCDTRTGRCGEWANLFGCILRSFDYDVRFIDNFEDHVWNEYWSDCLNKWIHVDSCENAWNTPLLYEQGWGRNMTFIIAYSVNGVYDVTRRYVKDWKIISDRRSQVMIDMNQKLIEITNNQLREEMDPVIIEMLADRDLIEQMDLLKVNSIKEAEMIGRQSGSLEWRSQRGEFKQ